MYIREILSSYRFGYYNCLMYLSSQRVLWIYMHHTSEVESWKLSLRLVLHAWDIWNIDLKKQVQVSRSLIISSLPVNNHMKCLKLVAGISEMYPSEKHDGTIEILISNWTQSCFTCVLVPWMYPLEWLAKNDQPINKSIDLFHSGKHWLIHWCLAFYENKPRAFDH